MGGGGGGEGFSAPCHTDFNTELETNKVLLTGPNHEKFVVGIFTQTRPVWIDELKTRQKKMVRTLFLFSSAKCLVSDICDSAFIFFFSLATSKKKLFLIASINTPTGLGSFFLIFNFYSA